MAYVVGTINVVNVKVRRVITVYRNSLFCFSFCRGTKENFK